jgi:transcriptional regulator with XRE-family HTH domain
VSDSKFRKAVGLEVARILREERERKNLSMTQLAADAGLSHAMISLVERGLRNPTLDTLLRITGVLKMDLDEVIKRAIAEVKK